MTVVVGPGAVAAAGVAVLAVLALQVRLMRLDTGVFDRDNRRALVLAVIWVIVALVLIGTRFVVL